MARILLENGYDVKVSEVHGMSQRGGSVVTYVRYGEKVYSPIIDKGEADIIISFELLEAARWVEYLNEDGILLTNTQRIWQFSPRSSALDLIAFLRQSVCGQR